MSELIGDRPGFRVRDRTERVVAVAEAQRGVLSRAQLLAHGISRSAISRWEAGGRLRRLYPNVFALGHRALDEEGRLRAALLYGGRGAVLSHFSAVRWCRLLEVNLAPIHVSVERERPSIAGLVLHRPREIERAWHNGLPVTPVARTLLDIAPLVPFHRLRRALAEAIFLRTVDLDDIDSVCRRGRRGSRVLRRALALHRPQLARTRSQLEERFLALCEKHAIPLPEVNVTVCGHMVDALWRREQVVVELDGYAAHGTGWARERDYGRDLDLRGADLRVLRYTWAQVTRQEEAVARDLRAALGLN